jgi:hypothetical protein
MPKPPEKTSSLKVPGENPFHPHWFLKELANSSGKDALARINRFKVAIGTASTSGLGLIEQGGDESLDWVMVQAFTFPGRDMLADDYSVYGPSIPIPYGVQYGNATMTLLCHEDHRELKYFNEWQMGRIIDGSYDVQFLSEYGRSVQIVQLGDATGADSGAQGFEKYKCTLYNAYPETIQAIPLDNSATSEILKLNIDFKFSHWSAN